MAPPKTKPAATVANTANFFKRGKKPTTANRIITAKKSLTTTIATTTQETNNTKSQHNSREYLSSSPKEQGKHSQNATVALIDQNYDEWEGLGTQAFDEIQSDGSWEPVDSSKHSENDNHVTEYKLFSEVTTPSSTIPAKRAISEAKSATSTLANGIHRNGFSLEEKKLRQFDLATRYGPCLDLTRLERWERAFVLGLDPPQDIKDLLLEKNALNSSLFADSV
ncbi:hypothetical protein BGX21_009287 [Mortierella sp. AD011]|nr:hypothetical protein BGX20_008810 [Mortierella sp. AD010]KAF9397075.1 hypothetical protein BGX21_009287 [Mortierella sp. AD011]